MKKDEREKLFGCYPVLTQLSPDLFLRIEQESQLIRVPAGRELFHEGSPCKIFPLLFEGTIRATKCGPQGNEILLYKLNPGESCVITVVALLGQTSYPGRGTAETDLGMLAVPRALFLELILTSQPFRMFVFQFLSHRMAHLMTLIDDVAFRRVDQRLASRLLLTESPIIITHQALADELGTTREVISRTLEAFQDSGLLRLGRKRIEILNRQALNRVYRMEDN